MAEMVTDAYKMEAAGNGICKFRPRYPTGRPVVPGDSIPPPHVVWLHTLSVVPKLLKNPLEAFAEFHFEVPISKYKIFSTPYAQVNDPDLIRHIFVEHAGDLKADPIRQKILRPALRDGLLTIDGERWKSARRTIAPVFSPRHVSGFAETMQTVATNFADSLRNGPENISVSDEMARITYLVLSETLFSGEINDDSNSFLRDTAYFIKHMSKPDPFDLMLAPDWLPRLTKFRGPATVKRMRKAVNATAQARRADMDGGKCVPDDFLTLLLRAGSEEDGGLSLQEVEDNIITFIAAGHETTARALTWTLYLLAKDEEAREKAQAEADALDPDNVSPENAGAHLPWITACIEESMRLFPPAAMILRQTTKDIRFKDYQIAAGTTVYVSPWVLHRHKDLWSDPSAFDPRRFYGENREAIGRFSYLPFGLGPRVCIGASFAMMEMQIVLATLLRNFRFDYLEEKEPWPTMKITIQPDNGMPMTISPRKPQS